MVAADRHKKSQSGCDHLVFPWSSTSRLPAPPASKRAPGIAVEPEPYNNSPTSLTNEDVIVQRLTHPSAHPPKTATAAAAVKTPAQFKNSETVNNRAHRSSQLRNEVSAYLDPQPLCPGKADALTASPSFAAAATLPGPGRYTPIAPLQIEGLRARSSTAAAALRHDPCARAAPSDAQA